MSILFNSERRVITRGTTGDGGAVAIAQASARGIGMAGAR
jgi:hypothetical protein